MVAAKELPPDPRQELSTPSFKALFEWRGAGEASDEELVALLFDHPRAHGLALSRARTLLHQEGGLLGLARLTFPEMTRRLRLSEPAALRLAAALELHRRLESLNGVRVRGAPLHPGAVAAWGTSQLGALDHEEVWALVVDGRSCLRFPLFLARGGAHGCALLPKDILAPVLRVAGAGFVLVHNHPSGDPSPSHEDIALTQHLSRGAAAVGCSLLDHVIIAGAASTSLRESGHF